MMKFKLFLLSAIAIALPITVNAAPKKSNDRWFEIEVILFSQLSDKSQLKETFPETSELPKYRRTTDLLANYVNPDITSLKQLLPDCESPQYKADLVSQQATLPALFTEKTLAQISALPTEQSNSTEVVTDVKASRIESESTDELSFEQQAVIQALVLAAEQEFNGFTFSYTTTSTPKLLCKIDEKQFANMYPNTDYNGITIDKMPLLINAKEYPYNNNTHLLAKESLQLGDVTKDLRHSKNFRPILHMGWRQVARPQKQSVPVKVYAGENFTADYQKKLARYQKQKAKPQQTLSDDRFDSDNAITASDITTVNNNSELQLEQLKQARIADIVAQISQVSEDTEQLLASIENTDLSLNVNGGFTQQDKMAPIPPVQNWFLEGLFNVHLKHYLFITADFTILDKNLSELATAQASAIVNGKNDAQPIQAKAIRFKQNRRVISGEVHYFDHPYMGMVVQIRPYKKPEPPQENASGSELDLKTH